MKSDSVARLEARLSGDLYALLKRAAEMQGRTLTDFVVGAAREAAQRTIADAEVMRLSAADQVAFASALLQPPPPGDALKRAVSSWSEHVERR